MIMSTLQEVATEANKLSRKPSRKKAFELLAAVLSDQATLKEQAELYRFFMPNVIKDRIGKKWDWVLSATNPKANRPFCRYVHSNRHQLVAIDGYRMHTVNLREGDDWPEGIYDKDGALKSVADAMRLPDLTRPFATPGDFRVIDPASLEVRPTHGGNFAYVLTDQRGVNKKYLDEALAFSTGGICKYWLTAKKVTVVHAGAHAVIMLMQLK